METTTADASDVGIRRKRMAGETRAMMANWKPVFGPVDRAMLGNDINKKYILLMSL